MALTLGPPQTLVQEDVGDTATATAVLLGFCWGTVCPAQLWSWDLPCFRGMQTAWRRLAWRRGLVLSGGRTWPSGIHRAGGCSAGLQ